MASSRAGRRRLGGHARSQASADRWQDRFDRLVLIAAGSAVFGVALQTLAAGGALRLAGFLATTVAWLIFAVDAAVMLSVSPQPGAWARGHRFELFLLVATCPLWPVLFYRLLLLELLSALTVLEATKLAKLIKIARAVRRRSNGVAEGRLVAGVLLAAAAAVAALVVGRSP